MRLSSSKLDVTKTGNGKRGAGSGERGAGNGEREAGTGSREWGRGNGEQVTERETRNGERGTRNKEQGTGGGLRAGSGERAHLKFAFYFCKKIDATINSSEHKQ